ncbi:MAG: hypothetical protein R3D55_21365 [Chloroflexota bacterium]
MENGRFTLNGGTITDNESTYGGGAYVVQASALLTLNGGSLSGNRSTAGAFGGGGLYIFMGAWCKTAAKSAAIQPIFLAARWKCALAASP